jgi:hypothetical protein
MRWDDYPDDVANLLGVTQDHSWNAGIEFATRINADIRLSLAYNFESHKLHMQECCGGAAGGISPNNTWQSDITQHYNTFIAALDWKAIPNKLDFRFEYVFAQSLEANNTIPCPSLASGCSGLGTGVTSVSQLQYPDEKNVFQRFSAIARYIVDPELVQRMGWNGEVVAKARYTFERNHQNNWAINTMTPYSPSPADSGGDTTNGGTSLFLAYNNPNYTAHLMAMSVALRW